MKSQTPAGDHYKAIIFDFFGVIHVDTLQAWLEKSGYKRTGDFEKISRLVDLGRISARQFYERLAGASGQPVAAIEAAFATTSDMLDRELLALIGRLHRSYKTGLLSNSSSEYLRPLLAEHGLPRFFDAVVISAEVGAIKPSPEIFELMLKKLAVEPRQAIFIDDNPKNVQAAAAMGIRSITYRGRPALEQELEALGAYPRVVLRRRKA